MSDVFPDTGDMPEFKDGPTRPTGIKFQINTDGLTPERVYISWYGLVENFTSRDLTKEHDKLIAVSGMASEISRILGGDQYLAGLWRNDCLTSSAGHPISPENAGLHRPIALRPGVGRTLTAGLVTHTTTSREAEPQPTKWVIHMMRLRLLT